MSLTKVEIFHTDRGNEFKNKIIDEVLKAFEIKRSLSKKGYPYDIAVAEAGYKIIKTEFVFNRTFKNLEELKRELKNYVLWYNYRRIHSALKLYDTSRISSSKSDRIIFVLKNVNNPSKAIADNVCLSKDNAIIIILCFELNVFNALFFSKKSFKILNAFS
ncbi:hypothetical protein K144316041_18190 [Clostridium tetani]|nr:hypothetical protein K144316041_18190 [Clostridium tetani]